MKRYLVFYGADYYPSGGIDDLLIDTDDLKEGVDSIKLKLGEDYSPEHSDGTLEDSIKYNCKFNWGHIYDTKVDKVIWTISKDLEPTL